MGRIPSPPVSCLLRRTERAVNINRSRVNKIRVPARANDAEGQNVPGRLVKIKGTDVLMKLVSGEGFAFCAVVGWSHSPRESRDSRNDGMLNVHADLCSNAANNAVQSESQS